MMTKGRLAGHSVLVTGASSGIGLGIARKMADYVTGTTLFVDGGMTLYPEFRDNG